MLFGQTFFAPPPAKLFGHAKILKHAGEATASGHTTPLCLVWAHTSACPDSHQRLGVGGPKSSVQVGASQRQRQQRVALVEHRHAAEHAGDGLPERGAVCPRQ